MGRVVPASVGWALWGKPEGSSDDFRLLGFSSGLMSSQAFEQVLTRFSPGTPPERAGLPGSLPWIMVGGIRIAKQPYLSLAIRERTDLLDGAGRAAPQTRYFCVSYADLRGAPVCYADLLDEVSRRPDLPVGSHPAFTLDLPCLAPEAAVTAMESRKFTEAAVSGTAALLLSGPVAIVGADNSVSARERLDFIDAVAALLPFGFRTGFTAATWSNSSNHPFRLAFADSPRQDAVVVRWRADPPPPPPGAGERYLENFQAIRGRWRDRAGLVGLVDYLGSLREPCGFDQPEQAADALAAYRRSFFVHRAVLAGASAIGSPPFGWDFAGYVPGGALLADIRRVLADGEITQLEEPEARRLVFTALIEPGDPGDIELITKHWAEATSGDAAAMAPVLFRVCKRLLNTPGAVGSYMKLAGDHGVLDPVLARLVPLAAAQDAAQAAQLVLDGLPYLHQHGGRETGRALRDCRLAACELVSQYTRPARHAGLTLQYILDWLQRLPPMDSFLLPFAIVCGLSDGPVTVDSIGELVGYDRDCVRVLLRTASLAKGLDQVLEAFANWLARAALSAGRLDSAVSRDWHNCLTALEPPDAKSKAWIDIALLASRNSPVSLLKQPSKQAQRRYDEHLARLWGQLVNKTGAGADGLLAEGLTDVLSAYTSPADIGPADYIAQDLISQLATIGHYPRLREEWLARRPEPPAPEPPKPRRRSGGSPGQSAEAESEAAAAATGQDAAAEAAPRQSASTIETESRGQATVTVVMDDRALLPGRPRPGATSGFAIQDWLRSCKGESISTIAYKCTEAYDSGITARAAGGALSESEAISSITEALELLERLTLAVFRPPGGEEPDWLAAAEWVEHMTEMLATGGFGPQLAAGAVTGRFAQFFLEGTALRLNQVQILFSAGWQPTKQDADDLEEIARLARNLASPGNSSPPP